MHFAHVIQSRKGRASVVLIVLAIIAIAIAGFFLLSGGSPEPFRMEELYGLLD
jgi:hypothetical protein